MCIYDTISFWASIATLLLFVLYIIGHIYKINQIKSTLSEEYQFENYFDLNGPKPKQFFEVSKGVGRIFSVSSPVGIKEIRIFDVRQLKDAPECEKGTNVGKLTDIKPNEKAYIKVDIPDLFEGCFIELEKYDGIVISFGIAASGYDGSFIQTKYSLRMTMKSWIYYICS